MQSRTWLRVFRAISCATLGLAPLAACDSSRSGTPDADAGGTSSGGSFETGGQRATGGGGVETAGAETGGIGESAGSSGVGTGGVGTGGVGTGGVGTGGVGTGGATGGSGAIPGGGAPGTGGGDAGPSSCQNPAPRLGPDGNPNGFVDCAGGFTHRPEKKTCASALPRPGTCGSGPPVGDAGLADQECNADTDCKATKNGFCEQALASCVCSYGCATDTDCGTGELCGCGNPVGVCIPTANCATDADCGAGLLCISSKNPGGCGSTFACQTANDTCTKDSDCPTSALSICVYTGDHHACGANVGCAPVGGSAR